MADQKIHHVAPSVRETAFNCPHCGALTTQTWFKIYATDIGEDEARLPRQVSEEEASLLTFDQIEDAEQRKELKDWFAKMALGVPFLDRLSSSAYSSWAIYNLNVSRCFNCKRLAVWVGDNLAWPVAGEAPAATQICLRTYHWITRRPVAFSISHPGGQRHCCGSQFRSSASA